MRPLHLATIAALLVLAGCNQSQPVADATTAGSPADTSPAATAPQDAAADTAATALSVTPSRIEACEPGEVATVRWNMRATHPEIADVEIWTGAPGHQTLFAAGGYAGEASTEQPWAHPGTTFTVRNKAGGAEIATVVIDGPACQG